MTGPWYLFDSHTSSPKLTTSTIFRSFCSDCRAHFGGHHELSVHNCPARRRLPSPPSSPIRGKYQSHVVSSLWLILRIVDGFLRVINKIIR